MFLTLTSLLLPRGVKTLLRWKWWYRLAFIRDYWRCVMTVTSYDIIQINYIAKRSRVLIFYGPNGKDRFETFIESEKMTTIIFSII